MNHELIYEQGSGRLLLEDRNDCTALLAIGYSGAPGYVNSPGSQGLVAKGPIPLGLWRVERAGQHETLGPQAIPLTPISIVWHEGAAKEVASVRRINRSGFYIHGDNAKGNQSASRGCIIMPRPIRDCIVALGIKRLSVIL